MIKKTILDVLMYIFNNYIDPDSEQSTDEEFLRMELIEVGFSEMEIGKAFRWLAELSEPRNNLSIATKHSLRMYTNDELMLLNVECRGFLIFLEQIEVLGPATRELVIDRIMALEINDMDLDQLKWVILMILFNQPGQEVALAWMEDLVFNEIHGYLH